MADGGDRKMDFELRQFVPSYEAFGIVVDYIGRTAPFDRLTARELLPALKHQVGDRHHVAAFRGETLIGYVGWLYTTQAMGEAWLAGRGEAKSVPELEADAAVLATVRVDVPEVLMPIIRKIREIGKGKRIYFRRDYGRDGGAASRKQQTVFNG